MVSLLFLFIIFTLIPLILLKRQILSLILVSVWLFGFVLVATGFLPSLLLSGLQKYPYGQTQLNFKRNNAIVVLGGGVAVVSKKVLLPSLLTYSRIMTAAQTYFSCKKTGHRCTIITSGGDVKRNGDTEAHVYQIELVSLGVKARDIRSESKSRSTYENAKFSTKLIKAGHYDQVFLISSGVHIERALLSFEHFGVSAIPVASDYMQPRISLETFGYNLALTDAALHEYLGVIKYRLSEFKLSKAYS